MIDVEIEAHADRVGGDQIIDVAGLIERDLGVARARRQRAQYDRGAAALTPNEFGDGVDFVGRERDDRGATRQPRQLLLASVSEPREPRPADDIRPGQQPFDHLPHGPGAEHQSFLATAPMQHAVGEHVSAFEVGAELHFIDRQEGHVEIARHRLDRGYPEPRIGRLDLLFAGDERDRFRADRVGHFVVDLAREKTQRQPDNAGGMGQHPLDGEMGFAGVGRPEDRRDPDAASAGIAVD